MKQSLAALLLLIVSSPTLWAASDPMDLLQNVAEKMTAFLDANKSEIENNEELAKQIVRQELVPLIDTKGLGYRLLKRSVWKELTEDRQARFTRAFINHLIDTYASGLAKYDGHQFRFLKTDYRNGNKTAYVLSKLDSNDNESFTIVYTMKLLEDEVDWKVVDISIDGIKIIQNYREQLKGVQLDDDFDVLLAKIESRIQ